MAKGPNQKLKLLYLMKIFMEETDEQHGLTMPQLIEKLHAYGVNADRKTLYMDMEELRTVVDAAEALIPEQTVPQQCISLLLQH